MDDRESKELLRRLTQAAGAPGAEDEVRRIVRETLEGVSTISHDRLGSLICERRGTSDAPRVMLDSHLDEVAFLVQSITDEGNLSLVPLGGWWTQVVLAQRVDVLTEGRKVPGVIGATPPHFLTRSERDRAVHLDKMYVDIGASSRQQVEQLGIRPGDPVVPAAPFVEMDIEDVISAKALDNRLGVCLMCETLLGLGEVDHPNTAIGVGAVQEEIGARGAGTAAELLRPDVAVILECTPADDIPDQKPQQAVLGKGPQVRLYDPTALPNRRLVRLVEAVASDIGVEIQLGVRRSGGTDAGTIHRVRTGVPAVVIGVPARYIHSHAGLCHWQDYRAARTLVLEVVKRLDDETVAGLTTFD